MALLPNQASANDCRVMTIVSDEPPTARISASFRRRLKDKERKLQRLPCYRHCFAATDVDIRRLLDWFFFIKPLRMAKQKLPNVFPYSALEDFIPPPSIPPLPPAGPALDIHSLN